MDYLNVGVIVTKADTIQVPKLAFIVPGRGSCHWCVVDNNNLQHQYLLGLCREPSPFGFDAFDIQMGFLRLRRVRLLHPNTFASYVPQFTSNFFPSNF